MRQNGIIALFEYWNRLRGRRPAPKRTEIKPNAIGPLLADTFILQVTSGGDITFRLAGTRICGLYGYELKGIRFASLWQEDDRNLTMRLLQSVLDSNDVIATRFEGRSSQGRKQAFEMLLLPLSHEEDDRRILGTICAIGEQYWLGAHPLVENTLKTVRSIDPDSERPFQMNTTLSVPAIRGCNAAASHEHHEPIGKPSGYRKVGHLYVYDGGRIVGRH